MVNWQERGAAERLLAAIIAASDNKVDCHKVARLFGKGATYNTIENQMRTHKKLAITLKEEAAGRDSPAPKTSRSSKKKADLDHLTTPVKGARVTKRTKIALIPTKVKNKRAKEASTLLHTVLNETENEDFIEEI